MRLARFFHRARDNDGRKLLLTTQPKGTEPQRPIVMGLTLGDHVTEFLRRDHGGLVDAVAAFNAAADRLQRQGYIELAETDDTASRIPIARIVKPEWQRGLDRLVLSLFLEDGKAQSRLIGRLAR